MNSSKSIVRRLVIAAATVGAVLLFGASGAQATPPLAAGPLVAENHEDDNPDQEPDNQGDEDDSDNEDENSDNEDEDNSDEDNESDEPTDEPTDRQTFTDPPTTDATDGTEMPTNDADATSESGASPLGWILLGGGVICAAAAVAVYRRNRHIM